MRRHDIVTAARAWIGTPYHHQASLKGVGCDCLGLVRGVWRELIGKEPEVVPPYSPDWAEAKGRETLLEGAGRHFHPIAYPAPGSLLIFRWKSGAPAKHVGISTGEGFVHAYDAAGRVVEGAMVPSWRRRLVAWFDFPGVTD